MSSPVFFGVLVSSIPLCNKEIIEKNFFKSVTVLYEGILALSQTDIKLQCQNYQLDFSFLRNFLRKTAKQTQANPASTSRSTTVTVTSERKAETCQQKDSAFKQKLQTK